MMVTALVFVAICISGPAAMWFWYWHKRANTALPAKTEKECIEIMARGMNGDYDIERL